METSSLKSGTPHRVNQNKKIVPQIKLLESQIFVSALVVVEKGECLLCEFLTKNSHPHQFGASILTELWPQKNQMEKLV